MTIEEFLASIGRQPWVPITIFVSIPLVSWLIGLTHKPEQSVAGSWKYVYTLLMYLAAIPGVFAAVVVAYTMFFERGNLLQLNVLVTFLPIASMVATLVIVTGRVDVDRLPGMERLWGFMGLLTLSFVVAFMLDRLRIWLFFGGGMVSLLIFSAVIYIGLKTVTRAALGRRR